MTDERALSYFSRWNLISDSHRIRFELVQNLSLSIIARICIVGKTTEPRFYTYKGVGIRNITFHQGIMDFEPLIVYCFY